MTEKHYIGIDVGGTKISGALVKDDGEILSRDKIPTPRGTKPMQVLESIAGLVRNLMEQTGILYGKIDGIGMGVPGVVDTKKGMIVVAPNIRLAGIRLGDEMKKRFQTNVLLGNDVNVGLLGERWLGAARGVKSVIGLFPGTGVGGAIIIDGKMLTGVNGAAAELGHMIIERDGPLCNCGNKGCLEAIAGRWAIERDIRTAFKKKKSRSKRFSIPKGEMIKSKILNKFLKEKNPIVTPIMNTVSVTLGMACRSIRHIFDPEMIVFGGGVIEACGDFMLPVIQKTVQDDPFFSRFPACEIVESELGDDSVILGAVALVNPEGSQAEKRHLRMVKSGGIAVKEKIYTENFYVRLDGKVKKRRKKYIKKSRGPGLNLNDEELKEICKTVPEKLIIASKAKSKVLITQKGKDLLQRKGIFLQLLSVPEAVKVYNKNKGETAIFVDLIGETLRLRE